MPRNVWTDPQPGDVIEYFDPWERWEVTRVEGQRVAFDGRTAAGDRASEMARVSWRRFGTLDSDVTLAAAEHPQPKGG